MKSRWIVILTVLVLLLSSAVPSYAARGGGHFHGGFHGGFHHGCCWWGPGAVVGALALGAALTWPFYAYPYYAYGSPYYAPTYAVYAPPAVVPQPSVVYQQPASAGTYQPPAVQREVVYPNGRYILYGDGVTQPWQWVWVPTAPPAPPPPPR